MRSFPSTKTKYFFFLSVYLLLFAISYRHPLFWDTVQFAGHHPNWYYHTQFTYFLLPDYCDSGHPPIFGMYIAGLWTLLGKSLAVTHLAMLPFMVLLVVQVVRLGNKLFPLDGRKSFLLTALLLSEGVLLAQCSLVSPDILVVAFFLTGLNAILNRKRFVLLLIVLFMGMISMRAMMAAVALYCFSLIVDWEKRDNTLPAYFWQKVLPFIPGGMLSLAYMVYHYLAKGWMGYHADSPWAYAFESVNFADFTKNLLVLGWRLVDIGKVATFVSFLILLWFFWRRKNYFINRKVIQKYLLFTLILFVLTALPLTLYSNLLMHRYIIPLYLLIGLTTLLLLFSTNLKWKYHWAVLLIVVQLSGHFWRYPPPRSQGWDATLAHLPYYSLRDDFKAYMQEKQISPEEVATAFPMAAADSFIDLKGNPIPYKDFRTDSAQYVWYSNVCNDMLHSLSYYRKHWEPIKQEKKGAVEMILFKRKSVEHYPEKEQL